MWEVCSQVNGHFNSVLNEQTVIIIILNSFHEDGTIFGFSLCIKNHLLLQFIVWTSHIMKKSMEERAY